MGRKRSKRELIDVAERKKEDKSLDKLIAVRRQRLDRMEFERLEARQQWRQQRARLRQEKQGWSDAVAQAQAYWQQARAGFFKMTTSSGQFRQSKAVYERLQQAAALLLQQAWQTVAACRVAGRAFFDANQQLSEARRQLEKLSILRDEIRSQRPSEDD
ncbi:hypothetical protein LT85_0510 [Collimonas arenae]|uniref:Uncharacterized protein n=2 Tax=Collimonas arenae TaxID=279058 RepID=A0A0A1F799_9BURK|nr:hypothetical protein LT85_0510 [Collimonas arenae]